MRELVDIAIAVALKAGEAILSVTDANASVEHKQDGSPLTAADKASHQTILAALERTAINIVSEEGNDLQMDVTRYWLVDPLDGTKDFLAKNGEYTINIGLVEDGRPVMGVVYAPAINALYWGGIAHGAWLRRAGSDVKLGAVPRSAQCRMAVSRFHDHADVDLFAADNTIEQRIAIGSSLKFCLLASGEVDVSPRLVGSSEWDTAAGQAVLEAAGGAVLNWHTGEPLIYGKKGRRNSRFLALRAPYTVADFKLLDRENVLL